MTRRSGVSAWRILGAATVLALSVPLALAQGTCEDLSGQCTTTALADCVDAVGNSVQVQLGGLGAQDSDANGGTCAGVPATAVVTFTKTAEDEIQVSLENTTCGDTSSITAIFFNTTPTLNVCSEASPFTDPDPTLTPWSMEYSQTESESDGFGFRADGFGNFDVAIHNGQSSSPNGGNPNELREGGVIVFKALSGSYDLCDFLSEISEPPPGDRNRSTVGRFQSCGVNGDSAFIGPCTPEDSLLAVISSITLTPGDRRVDVDWQTSLEIDNAGFNVLRRERGAPWVLVNPSFIPGAGDTVSGASYRFEDLTALNGVEYEYRIEDIDFQGINGLSEIRKSVPNPQDSEVRLQSPAYGAPVSLDRTMRFAFETTGFMRGSGRLQVSSDPSFEGRIVSEPVALRSGSREVKVSGRLLTAMEEEAASSGGTLYWRVTGRDGTPISDTFRMEVE